MQSGRPECAVTQWSDWSPCSVTCASGVSVRQREYLMPAAAKSSGCNIVRDEKERCEAERRDCSVTAEEAEGKKFVSIL